MQGRRGTNVGFCEQRSIGWDQFSVERGNHSDVRASEKL